MKKTATATLKCPGCKLTGKVQFAMPGFLSRKLIAWKCETCESEIESWITNKSTSGRIIVADKSVKPSELLKRMIAEEAEHNAKPEEAQLEAL